MLSETQKLELGSIWGQDLLEIAPCWLQMMHWDGYWGNLTLKYLWKTRRLSEEDKVIRQQWDNVGLRKGEYSCKQHSKKVVSRDGKRKARWFSGYAGRFFKSLSEQAEASFLHKSVVTFKRSYWMPKYVLVARNTPRDAGTLHQLYRASWSNTIAKYVARNMYFWSRVWWWGGEGRRRRTTTSHWSPSTRRAVKRGSRCEIQFRVFFFYLGLKELQFL